MCKESSIALGKIKAAVTRLPLPANFSRILSVMLNHVDRNTYHCWPSKVGIAGQVGLSEKTVTRHVKLIIELGLFKVETLGRKEMEFRIGKKMPGRDTSQRRYCLYTLNGSHKLWKGIDVELITFQVRIQSHDGIGQRLKVKAKRSTSVINEDPRQQVLFAV